MWIAPPPQPATTAAATLAPDDMGRATDGVDGHRRRSERAIWHRSAGATSARATTDCVAVGYLLRARVRPTGTPSGARVRGPGAEVRAPRLTMPPTGSAPHLGSPNGAITRSHRQVAVDVGAGECTAAGAPVDRRPTRFPHRRLTNARRLRGLVQPRPGEAPDAPAVDCHLRAFTHRETAISSGHCSGCVPEGTGALHRLSPAPNCLPWPTGRTNPLRNVSPAR